MKPLAVDLCAGLGGWAEGLLAEGWDCVGFDIERHEYGEHRYPAQLVLQDILTLDGRQFRGRVSLIVASPPCQKYSYMAMPWKRAKILAAWYRDLEHPERLIELNALFDACFRIAREAEVPIVLENVRGAQPWVGRARWMYGSFALWGDVPALMPTTLKAHKFNPDGTNHGQGSWFAVADSKNRGAREGGEHTKVPGLNWHGHGTPGYKPQGFNVTAAQRYRAEGKKCSGSWFGSGNDCSPMRQHSSKSNSRKAASAMIAKIPLPLSRWIGRTFLANAEELYT